MVPQMPLRIALPVATGRYSTGIHLGSLASGIEETVSHCSCFEVAHEEPDDCAVKKHTQCHTVDWYCNHSRFSARTKELRN